MKPIRIHPEAQTELDEAIRYYEQWSPGLGIDFRERVETGTRQIQATPLRFMSFSKNTRRFLVRRFPYQLVYIELAEYIFIVAVSHGKRKPGYWHGRI